MPGSLTRGDVFFLFDALFTTTATNNNNNDNAEILTLSTKLARLNK